MSLWKAALLCGSLAVASRVDVREAAPQQPNTWKDWGCPSPSTITVAQYATNTVSIYATATIYETKTQPTTIYQTTILTEIVTASTTETDLVVSPTTITKVATSPLTLTATLKEELFTSTTKLTSLIICPTRIANPTYTAQGSYPSDWTWGCPVNWLCKPKQENCNFEAGLPDRGFYCAPNECIPAETLPAILPTWDDTIYGNSSGLGINAIDSFFNMNPTNFGLTYEIFVVDEVFTYTSTITILPTPTVGARQAQTSVPGACYPWCNNCLLEAQSAGKTPKLCQPGSAFEVSLTQCELCINVHRGDDTAEFVEIAPQFQQFLDYCAQYSTAVVSTVAVSTVAASSSTYTTLVPTTSVSIVPTKSASLYSTLLSSSISSQGVSTATLVFSSATPAPRSTSSLTPVAPASTAPLSTPASAPPKTASVYTTTLTTTTTSTETAITYSGAAVTPLTIIMTLNNTATTMTGTALTNATVIVPSTTTVISSYVTTLTLTSNLASTPPAVPASSATPTSIATGAPTATPSTFTGNVAVGLTPLDSLWSLIFVLLACLMIL